MTAATTMTATTTTSAEGLARTTKSQRTTKSKRSTKSNEGTKIVSCYSVAGIGMTNGQRRPERTTTDVPDERRQTCRMNNDGCAERTTTDVSDEQRRTCGTNNDGGVPDEQRHAGETQTDERTNNGRTTMDAQRRASDNGPSSQHCKVDDIHTTDTHDLIQRVCRRPMMGRTYLTVTSLFAFTRRKKTIACV